MCTVAAQLLYKLFSISHSATAVNSNCQQQQYPTLHTALLLLNRDYTAVAAYLEHTLFGSCSSNYSSSSTSTSIGSSGSATYASPRKQQQQQQRQQQHVNLTDDVHTAAVTHAPLTQKAGVLFEREGLITGLTTVRAIASTSSAAAAADTAAMSDLLSVTEAFAVHQNGYTTTAGDTSDSATATTVAWLRAAVLAVAVVALPVPENSNSSVSNSSSSSSDSSTCAIQCMYEAMKQRLLMLPLQERQSQTATTALQSGLY
jgi:hypothetical protein